MALTGQPPMALAVLDMPPQRVQQLLRNTQLASPLQRMLMQPALNPTR
jgi:hypothetical protein